MFINCNKNINIDWDITFEAPRKVKGFAFIMISKIGMVTGKIAF
jgi:hypothetical protein